MRPFATGFPSLSERIHLRVSFLDSGNAATAPALTSAFTSGVGAP